VGSKPAFISGLVTVNVYVHLTQNRGHFGDVPQANLLAWYEKNKT